MASMQPTIEDLFLAWWQAVMTGWWMRVCKEADGVDTIMQPHVSTPLNITWQFTIFTASVEFNS